MKTSPFWIVWCPTGPTPPRMRHNNRPSAEAERDRLARVHVGHEFFVLRAESSAKKIDVEVTRFDEDVPF
jgi:hypothetical protein